MKDYWTFSPILESFKSTGYGKIEEHGGLQWRVRGGDFLLLTPPKVPFKIPEAANPARIRSLSFLQGSVGPEVPVKKSYKTYGAEHDWAPNKKCRYAFSLAKRDGGEIVTPEKEELHTLLTEWIEWAEERKNQMIVKGHYRQMIETPGFEFIGCRVGGKLVGATGYTVQDGHGAIGFAKHVGGYWWLSRLIWTCAIQKVLGQGAATVNCGDTADKLKQQMGLLPEFQWRVDFTKMV